MKFNIPFDELIFRKQMNLNFNTVWNDNLKNNKKLLIWVSIMIPLGGLIIYAGNYVGFLLIATGLHHLVNFFNYISYYKKSKSNFFELVESEITNQKEANEICIWEFNEDHLRYKDYRCDTKIKWEAFSGVRIIDKNLFLDLNVGNNSCYIIGEDEVGIEHFQNLIDFVKNKIKKNWQITSVAQH